MDTIQTDQEALSPSTDLFSRPTLLMSEESSHYLRVYPINSISSVSPIIYEFESDFSTLISPVDIYHVTTFKIVKSDNSDIAPEAADADDTDTQKCGPANLYGSSFFNGLDVYLSGNLIESSNNMYGYKSIIQTILSNDKQTKDTQLALSGFFNDTGEIDTNGIRSTMDKATCGNTGLHKRYQLTKYSKSFTSVSHLHADICQQGRYLIPGTSCRIKLTRASPKFCLIANSAAKNFNYVITKAYLLVKLVRPRESLRLAIENSLQLTPAQYPIKRTEVRHFNFSGNSSVITEANLFTGKLPTRVALALVETSAFEGSYKLSPFKFSAFKTTEIDLRCNGLSVTTEPLRIDLDNNDHVLPYLFLYKSTGGLLTNESIMTYEEYLNGNFIFLYDLTADGEHDQLKMHTVSTGSLSLDLRASEAPGKPITLVVLLEFESLLTCDKEHQFQVLQ